MTTEAESIAHLANQASKLGKIIMEYRSIFASLYDLAQKPVTFDPDISKISKVEVMYIDKEEYERWQKVKSLINKTWNKG